MKKSNWGVTVARSDSGIYIPVLKKLIKSSLKAQPIVAMYSLIE